MTVDLYRMKAHKQMKTTLIDLSTGNDLFIADSAGSIMKGRNIITPDAPAKGPRRIESVENWFHGELVSTNLPGEQIRLTVFQNPTIPSTGFEEADQVGTDYPATQEFQMFIILTMKTPSAVSEQMNRRMSPDSTLPHEIFPMANRKTDPIRVRATLNKEWGLEPNLEYHLQDDRIPLWPWNWDEQDFYDINPVTGGEPIPAAYVNQEGDRIQMTGTWHNVDGNWIRRT